MQNEQVTVYKDANYFSAFTSALRQLNGDLNLVFRRAPQRKPYSNHLDRESQAVMVSSKDDGVTWSGPQVIREERGNIGVQDPSIMQCADGTMFCNYFSWQVVETPPYNHHVLGTFVIRSEDCGKTWSEPVKVDVKNFNQIVATSEPIIELPNGELLVPCYDRNGPFVMRSKDRGESWGDHSYIINSPMSRILNPTQPGEPSITLTPSGKVICMSRENCQGILIQSESEDLGKTWSDPVQTPMWGFPAHLLVLKDGRLLCTYGYRRPPFGVRACLSEDDGKSWNINDEIIIKNDGDHGDLGYPTSVQLPTGGIFTSFYTHDTPEKDAGTTYHQNPGTRYIAGVFHKV